ncbi:Uncharacterized protein TCAP_03747 [Tolypocladium capitatum]|uniref:Uncharacterized protein n=1 Tax=Tolypocladium capitatum TaxID=45235 RepID=A0A2K3QFL9_9HYPO|nr:Uncharacterized protein TCAP_03747 [Tolypocladium capitatum]
MFTVASGRQGRQTRLFSINHPQRGGTNMLILISAMRLDGDAASVVLDAAVIPITTELIAAGRAMECCNLQVKDAELVLWKRMLPSLMQDVEASSHRKGATVPLSAESAKQVLCSCGNGKLPKTFLSLPEWDRRAPSAVRVAISPTVVVPFAEEVI